MNIESSEKSLQKTFLFYLGSLFFHVGGCYVIRELLDLYDCILFTILLLYQCQKCLFLAAPPTRMMEYIFILDGLLYLAIFPFFLSNLSIQAPSIYNFSLLHPIWLFLIAELFQLCKISTLKSFEWKKLLKMQMFFSALLLYILWDASTLEATLLIFSYFVSYYILTIRTKLFQRPLPAPEFLILILSAVIKSCTSTSFVVIIATFLFSAKTLALWIKLQVYFTQYGSLLAEKTTFKRHGKYHSKEKLLDSRAQKIK